MAQTREEILEILEELKAPQYYSCMTEDVVKELKEELFELEHGNNEFC